MITLVDVKDTRKRSKVKEIPPKDEGVEKPKKLSSYLIRKELLDKDRCYNGWHCGLCHKRRNPRELKAIRVSKNGDSHQASDYVLMCEICRKKRAEKKEGKTQCYDEGIGIVGREVKKGVSKSAFYNRVRAEVLERDGHACCYCGSKENIGLAPIRPECKGGKMSIDNYTACCSSCRPSKGNMLPLDFIMKRLADEFSYELFEDLDSIKVGIGMTTINPYYLAEAMQFLGKLVSNKDLDRELRNKAERLVIKLGETDEDRSKKVKEELAHPLF